MRIRITGHRSCFMGCDIGVARRLPEDVLREDSALLMYFDNAWMRVNG
jgi:hypothetical protein